MCSFDVKLCLDFSQLQNAPVQSWTTTAQNQQVFLPPAWQQLSAAQHHPPGMQPQVITDGQREQWQRSLLVDSGLLTTADQSTLFPLVSDTDNIR